jgi:hypothetical protein
LLKSSAAAALAVTPRIEGKSVFWKHLLQSATGLIIAAGVIVVVLATRKPGSPAVPRGLDLIQLTHYGQAETTGGLGSDGTSLYFGERHGRIWGLARVPVGGGEPAPIRTTVPSPFVRDFSVARSELLAISDPTLRGGGDLWRIPVAGGSPRRE